MQLLPYTTKVAFRDSQEYRFAGSNYYGTNNITEGKSYIYAFTYSTYKINTSEPNVFA
jgi:hypothetical protein